MQVGNEFLSYNQDFFQEVEFTLMMFVVLVIMVVLSSILKFVPYEAVNHLVES